jgi:hypothetical protein
MIGGWTMTYRSSPSDLARRRAFVPSHGARPGTAICRSSVKLSSLVLLASGDAPERTVFVDDIAANLQPARELGMAVLHHVDPSSTVRELERLLGLLARPYPRR